VKHELNTFIIRSTDITYIFVLYSYKANIERRVQRFNVNCNANVIEDNLEKKLEWSIMTLGLTSVYIKSETIV